LLTLLAALVIATSPAPAASVAPTASPVPTATPVSTATPVPTPTPTLPPHAHTWQGITPGTSVTPVHARLGTALLTRQLPDGSTIDWYASGANAYLIVGHRNGLVTYVRAFPIDVSGSLDGLTDPWGVAPGNGIDALRARRGLPQQGRRLSEVAAVLGYDDGGGFMSLYEFDSGIIHAISLFDSRTPAASPAGTTPQEDPHDGASIGRAYVVHAPNEKQGVAFERYYATHRGGCRLWVVANQTVLSLGARKIDQLDLECADTKDQTSLFFDVTSFYGKT
jgi:hypothetical protein